MTTTLLHIKGTHCPACKTLIEDVCGEIPGVHSAKVDYQSGETTIIHDNTLNLETIKTEIQSLGDYRVIFK